MDTGNVLGQLPKSGEWQVELGDWGWGVGWLEFLQPRAGEPTPDITRLPFEFHSVFLPPLRNGEGLDTGNLRAGAAAKPLPLTTSGDGELTPSSLMGIQGSCF